MYICGIHQPQSGRVNRTSSPRAHCAWAARSSPHRAARRGTWSPRWTCAPTDQAWQLPTDQTCIGGTMTTAGGLVFTGEGNGNFNALDAKTGQRLWQFQTGAGVNAPPVTYEVGGNQYVAVAAGGNAEPRLPAWRHAVGVLAGRDARAGGHDGRAGRRRCLRRRGPSARRRFPTSHSVPACLASPCRRGPPSPGHNNGPTVHTATSHNPLFDSGDLAAGRASASSSMTPACTGTLRRPHPFMRGTITIISTRPRPLAQPSKNHINELQGWGDLRRTRMGASRRCGPPVAQGAPPARRATTANWPSSAMWVHPEHNARRSTCLQRPPQPERHGIRGGAKRPSAGGRRGKERAAPSAGAATGGGGPAGPPEPYYV